MSTTANFSLFESVPTVAPLAQRLRPQTFADVVGQAHLLGQGQPLRRVFESGRLHSMILWGPPGVGKTTLAHLMATYIDAQFIALSAVLGGVKDVRDAVMRAQAAQAQGRATVIFVDEIHRFNKSQQDAFLPHVESGLFIFIGATTENPSFEVNAALLSRATVHVLRPLSDADLQTLLQRATQVLLLPPLTPQAMQQMWAYADGDGRRLLNALENLAYAVQDQSGASGLLEIDEACVISVLGTPMRRFDKQGDVFYDTISALHKSVRGSDPDAALYWFARMLDGGGDVLYIARRLVRMASEDIGLADPRALQLSLDAMQTYERLGSPEGELTLAQAVVYLAMAPKSNATYKAYKAARAFVAQDGSRAVPMHLRNAPTRLMNDLGHGQGYRYAHDEPQAVAHGVSYWPDGVSSPRFYEPVDRGLELRIGERLRELRAFNLKTG